MHSRSVGFVLASLLATVFVVEASGAKIRTSAKDFGFAQDDWPWWRGPNRNGVASGELPPMHWSDVKNVVWKTSVSGRGHASPIVVGDRLYLPTATEDAQLVLCLDRHTGKPVWSRVVHDNPTVKGNKKSSLASSTMACDGERLFVGFYYNGAVFTSALTMNGEIVWQKKISDYVVHQGYGASPAIYGELVIVSADNKGGGAIAALNRVTGEIVWRHDRPSTPNYVSPSIVRINNRDQMVVFGCDLVSSFEPLSGDKLWEMKGATTECVTTTLTDGEHIFTCGGYPRNHLAAIRADGSNEVVWNKPVRVYVPSLLFHDGHLFATMDAGVAGCWNAATGEEAWRKRLGGTFTASPVLIGDRILATNEAGQTFVYRSSPEEFDLIAENQLGDEIYATPTVCGGRIYFRVAHRQDDKREEVLYCIGK